MVNHPEFVKAFGVRIKDLRKKYKLSQQKLANLSDVDIRTIQRIEQNEHNPTIDIAYSIALGFNIDVKELLDFVSAKDM